MSITCVVRHGRLVSVTLLLEDNVAKLKNPRDDPQQAFGMQSKATQNKAGLDKPLGGGNLSPSNP